MVTLGQIVSRQGHHRRMNPALRFTLRRCSIQGHCIGYLSVTTSGCAAMLQYERQRSGYRLNAYYPRTLRRSIFKQAYVTWLARNPSKPI
ncbi:hypothetical protein AG1IA_03534 [Rhizoctonia solani AG-1 IA]|uniref:Uncharacterized protein n=1 Tax=Thanatephorus cucumeris (strain AG1-IA) TaxID=983506 RepID=L8WWH3_THACA|nr:hypothetical protein AG1IA_03534 [Rhizoctonia solani AG-1 IA]